MYVRVKVTDGTNTFYSLNELQNVYCGSSSTTLSMLPDSEDPSVGFNHAQSIGLQAPGTGGQ